ncbi:MAG TPA: DOMON-like domain-containing protein [Candidatus Binatia bacterium]|nr:DOMON-like domain-containing protein [Candidatus Binatia bacterium]
MRGVAADASRPAPHVLALSFALDGHLGRLRIPAPDRPRRGERLWEHTCFEAFVAPVDGAGYHELNLAPSGAWAVHAFAGYRDGGPLADEGLAPRITADRTAERLALDAVVDLGRLGSSYASAGLRVALAAVVEAADGTRSYWALRHPPGRPDFHHADGFALVLDRPA